MITRYIRFRVHMLLLSILVIALGFFGQSCQKTSVRKATSQLTDVTVLERAFHNRQSNLQVTQRGEVITLLADDMKGSRLPCPETSKDPTRISFFLCPLSYHLFS